MAARASVGSQFTYWGYRTSGGYASGTNKALTNGQNSGMGRLLGATAAGLQKPATRNIVIPGDNGIFGSLKIAPADVPQGTIVMNAKDFVFATGPVGLLVDSLGGNDLIVDGVPCPTYEQLIIINNSPAIDDSGTPGWLIDIFMNVTADLVDGDTSDGAARQFTANLLGNYSTKFPWGKALAANVNGATKALRAQIFAPYPLTIHTLKRNTGVTTVVLNETPAGESASFVPAFSNGTALTYDAAADSATEYFVTVATKTVTLGLAGTSGDFLVMPYFFLPQC